MIRPLIRLGCSALVIRCFRARTIVGKHCCQIATVSTFGGLTRIATLICLLRGSASAQQLSGTVADSIGHQPLAGAVVLLLDSAATPLVRRITDQRGRFRMTYDARANALRVVRIGYRPRVLLIKHVVTQDQIAVQMMPVGALLERVTVASDPRCPRAGDPVATFSLLEQARAGLLAAVVAREENPAEMVRLLYVRRMEGAGERIESQDVHVDSSNQVRQSYRAARTGAEFVRLGFTQDTSGSQLFHGPDADALLDDGFLAGYCVRVVEAAANRRNQIGLGFAPNSRRRGRVDVEGTLWVDTASRALRDIEFRYLGLDPALDIAKPGGRISFREMPNGVVFIDRWFIRLADARDDSVFRGGSVAIHRTYFAREVGGEVAWAEWPGGYTWEDSLGTFRGQASDHNGKSVANLTVGLEGTSYRATTDSTGRLELRRLLPGPYTVLLLDSTLAPLGIMLKTAISIVAERGKVLDRVVPVTSFAEYVASRCPERSVVGRLDAAVSSPIVGRVVDEEGKAVAGVHLRLSIQNYDGSWAVLSDNGVTGSDGIFQYCEPVPRRAPMQLRLQKGRQPPTLVEFDLARPGGFTMVPVTLKQEY